MITFLFDFDGTLVDSMPTYTSVMLRILNENNILYAKDIIKTITPLGINGAAEYYINTLGKFECVDSKSAYDIRCLPEKAWHLRFI